MSLVLMGYRGCGKTTVGRKLADRLWQKFVDTDDLVIASAGKSIREIFKQDGEARFREMESDAVRDALGRVEHVIALGGGAVLHERNRQLLSTSNHQRIYLRCDPRELLRRIESDPNTADNRPALTGHGGGLAEIESLLRTREPLYRQVMTGELDVTNLSVDEAMVYLTRMA
jgi:shikimate kinase